MYSYDNIVQKTVDWIRALSDAPLGPEKQNMTQTFQQTASSKLRSNMFQHSSSKSDQPEIDQYLSLPVESCNIDPLQWWKSHLPQFPKLSCLAKEILAIPGSSVSVERVFNVGRDIIGIRRNALKPETISALMFGNHYIK